MLIIRMDPPGYGEKAGTELNKLKELKLKKKENTISTVNYRMTLEQLGLDVILLPLEIKHLLEGAIQSIISSSEILKFCSIISERTLTETVIRQGTKNKCCLPNKQEISR